MQQHLNRRPTESAEYLSHLQLSHSKYGGDESSVQGMSAYSAIANGPAPIQRQAAPQGGLPTNLKGGIESLSGIAMDDVRVHYNSSKPAQLQAHAYAQGTDIHIAPGQERHLPHEAWHVVQQKQGRVKPTLQLKGVAINDDSALEREADVMGGRAMGGAIQRVAIEASCSGDLQSLSTTMQLRAEVVQRQIKHGKMQEYAEIKELVEAKIGNATVASPATIWDGATKPSWINSDALEQLLARHQNLRTLSGPNDEKVAVCTCGICGTAVTMMGSGINHKQGWLDYLNSFAGGAGLTNEEAQILYNSPMNLELVHARCNSRKLERQQMVSRSKAKPTKTFDVEDEDLS